MYGNTRDELGDTLATHKTIMLRVEAYEKLRRELTREEDCFSDVVMRARWDKPSVTEEELVARARERGFLEDVDEAQWRIDKESGKKVPAEVVDALMVAVARVLQK